ncbi:phosphoenolpyruvate synthase [Termitidicoccus mucosus]|uniref:Phosphoenolpyruvate synthase n=2 Tax=Termitidicoccus mucosus TaxID=1184151 RepID=A0A178IE38_9BACT|nr:phosphoenolpyruvate synthase [Opitutaceae bacterium TSB47]
MKNKEKDSGGALLPETFRLTPARAGGSLSAMPKQNTPPDTSGLPAFDRAVGGILAGDNIVWHVDSIAQYQSFVTPFAAAAARDGRRLIYFRFARHGRLLPEDFPCETVVLRPEDGFEVFINRIRGRIGAVGLAAYYVFDCLSDLATDWYSDAMLGNFFMLTCPYLFELETIAYFGLLRGRHSRDATEPVIATTQLFLDVFGDEGRLYMRPLKTQFRRPPGLRLLHAWGEGGAGGAFDIVRGSAEITRAIAHAGPDWAADAEVHGAELWRRAEEAATRAGDDERPEIWTQFVRMMISRDEAIMPLVQSCFSLKTLLPIRRRLVGTGLIGGKTVGMLLARAIVARDCPEVAAKLEEHDSFYVGADVFYTFLVRNGLWPLRERQRAQRTFLDGVDEAQARVRAGGFPDYIVRQFANVLDHFGQYPIIVRSSSLLEDNYGRAFAGKYESVFCANQGTREERLEAFLDAVRTVYASAMSREALSYRARHGLLERDEQMALLVMRVTGSMQGGCFYPHLAGVGFSYNPFAWHPAIDPAAGVVRLVYGLGTRAVERVDDDYTRVVALNAPLRRPESGADDIFRHSQRRVDVIDLAANRPALREFRTLLDDAREAGIPVELLTTRDDEVYERTGREARFLTFEPLLSDASREGLVADLRAVLQALEKAYARPVDIEFAVNFERDPATRELRHWLHLLQCRPLQVQGTHNPDVPPARPAPGEVFLRAKSAVVGHSRVHAVDWIAHVRPEIYSTLNEQNRHAVARAIGDVNRALAARDGAAMLIGPGRWGTTTPGLGVPVRFSEINHFAVLCELAVMSEHLTPDISLGTHFFGELVEMNMLYFALFPGREGNEIDLAALAGEGLQNGGGRPRDCFDELAGEAAANLAAPVRDALRVFRAADFTALAGQGGSPAGSASGAGALWLLADARRQELVISRRKFV